MPSNSLPNFSSFEDVLVGFKNGSSLNVIQTWIIFLPLKIAKSIYSNPAQIQDSTDILISLSTLSYITVVFGLCFSVWRKLKERRSSSAVAARRSSPPTTYLFDFSPLSPSEAIPHVLLLPPVRHAIRMLHVDASAELTASSSRSLL